MAFHIWCGGAVVIEGKQNEIDGIDVDLRVFSSIIYITMHLKTCKIRIRSSIDSSSRRVNKVYDQCVYVYSGKRCPAGSRCRHKRRSIGTQVSNVYFPTINLMLDFSLILIEIEIQSAESCLLHGSIAQRQMTSVDHHSSSSSTRAHSSST